MTTPATVDDLLRSTIAESVREAVAGALQSEGRLALPDGSLPKPEPIQLTVEETAEALRLSAPYVRRLIARNELPHVRYGRSVRIPVEELRAYVREHVQGGDAWQVGERTTRAASTRRRTGGSGPTLT